MLTIAIVALLWAELAWVDDRPWCSGMAMELRPDLAGACRFGPRPLLVDAAIVPALVAVAAAGLLVALAWSAGTAGSVRSGRTPRG